MTTNTLTNGDAVLRRYLLGTLPQESLESVEQRVFSTDAILWEHLSLVEEQLVDDYVWGRLEGDDRERFDHHFLTTAERRAKVEFARALRAHVERQKRAGNRVRQWLRGPVAAPGWAVAVAAVLLLAVLPGLTWQLASTRAPRGVVSAWLAPGQVRDIEQRLERVEIGKDCQIVRLRLETAGVEYDTYSTTLFEVTDEPVEIWSEHRLTAVRADGKRVIALTLPAERLPEGDYYIALQGSSPGSDPQKLGRYSFRVLRH
jgi:hypothetical protein